MQRKHKFSAEISARLLVLTALSYGDEKGRDTSRFRMSRSTVRRISGWNRLSVPFMSQLKREMAELGWLFFDYSDTEVAAIQLGKVGSWVRLGSARVAHYRKEDDPESLILDAYDDAFPEEEEFDGDD